MKKKIHKYVLIELLALIGIFLVLFAFVPSLGDVRTISGNTFFEFKNANTILIDDNPDFSSPIRINENTTKLDPGDYYWKAIGILGESKTGNFSIDSEVIINMRVINRTKFVKNMGNVPVNATSKDRNESIITGRIIEEGEEKKIPEIDGNLSLEIEQNEEK